MDDYRFSLYVFFIGQISILNILPDVDYRPTGACTGGGGSKES